MRWGTCLLAFLAACSGAEIGETSTGGGAEDAGAPDLLRAADLMMMGATLSVTAPMAGQKFSRTSVGANGAQVARVSFSARASDDVVKVEYVGEDNASLGEAGAPDFALTASFADDGPRTVRARGKNAAGKEVASAQIEFVVEPGPMLSCREKLTALGVGYTVAPMTKGIADPVTVTLPLAGLKFFAYGQTTAQTKLLMDCSLALSLHRMAELLKPRGIVAVEHIGIYNYRCIGGGNPDTDNCEPSQHAYAQAIDLHELRDAAGKTYNVETDWVIDPDTEKTCTAPTANDKDKLLHEVACELNAEAVFAIVLTPNYNADHRNHLHVDLTDGADYINLTSGVYGVDPPRARPAH